MGQEVHDFARETSLKSFDISLVRCKTVLPSQQSERSGTVVSGKKVFGCFVAGYVDFSLYADSDVVYVSLWRR